MHLFIYGYARSFQLEAKNWYCLLLQYATSWYCLLLQDVPILAPETLEQHLFPVKIMTLMSFLISVIFGIVVILLRNVMSYASTEGTEVADAVAKLSPFLAFSIILKASHRLFEAKENTLSIVFVDEIDAIGRQTGLFLERRDSYLHEAEYLATTKS
jgi:hypothetical protein